MDRAALIERLMATFLDELQDHLRTLDDGLLALERESGPPDRAERIKSLFRAAHSLKGAARSVDATQIERACHRMEELLGGIQDGAMPLSQRVLQELFALADGIKQAGGALRARKRGVRLPEGGSAPVSDPKPPETAPRHDGAMSSVRVSASKLDALLDRSGELMVARRRIEGRVEDVRVMHTAVARLHRDHRRLAALFRRSGSADAQPAPGDEPATRGAGRPRRRAQLLAQIGELLRSLEQEVERLSSLVAEDSRILRQASAPLEEEIHRVRMLPFADACQGLSRSARDLAKAAGKDVELVVDSHGIELDRAVVEQLKDPLLHLVRNAIDHGVEPAVERVRHGKPACARITVSAALRGGNVAVSVADDGAGIDLSAVRATAERRGLPEANDADALSRLVFLPGFSTSTTVTEVSGRGVGLDVVKSRIESLHGEVGVSSESGRGTSFTLVVPLTLTIARVLLVRVRGQVFGILGAGVRSTLRIDPTRLGVMEGRDVLLTDATPVPVVSLADVLGMPARVDERAAASTALSIVVVAVGDHQAAFVVDELVDEQDVVVKSLGARLLRVKHITGASILPDGKVALVLKSAELVRTARGPGLRRPIGQRTVASEAPAQRRILVVDDSVTTRTLQKSILEGEGYEVVTAVDGAEAWRVLQGDGVDLVVSDVEMPRMDGFALTEAIRGSPRLRELPVVLVTALESEHDRARGVAVGADAYLPKSGFDPRQLVGTIKQLL